MARIKRGTTKHKKRGKLLKAAKGFRWNRKSKKRLATEALLHAWSYAFRGRKEKKREYRRLWNVKINAGAREHGMKYSDLISALKKKNIKLDRKILATLAQEEPKTFAKIVEQAKN